MNLRYQQASEVLGRVYHSLRNTLHVSTISGASEVAVDALARLSSTVIDVLQQGLLAALRAALVTLVPHAPPAHLVAPLPPTEEVLPEIPQSFIWAPPSRAATMAVAG